jgi:hypothetical protein
MSNSQLAGLILEEVCSLRYFGLRICSLGLQAGFAKVHIDF